MQKDSTIKQSTSSSPEYAIRVSNVSKTFRIPHEKITSVRGAAVSLFKTGGYEEFKALDDVSFEVKKGEFFGIIGRNGSGKSTLLKILAGIYQADRGKVSVSGFISPFLELGIGFNPELSGRDNIYLNATVLGLTKKEIDEKFDSIVKFSELERFIDQKLKNYSSGMQVRLAFSVSIHANRDILLMDEVLAVGDVNFQSKCLEEFNKYRDKGKTVILVTHDVATVERYCDRAMLLRNGKIKKIGKADEVANEYIYDNMDDEEERIKIKKELNIVEKNENIYKKNVEIKKILFFNENNEVKNVFNDSEKIKIRISYEMNGGEIIKKPCFGVAIHNEFNVHLFGVYTKIDNFETKPIENNGYIDLFFEQNNFCSGIYYVTGAIYNDNKIIPTDRKIKLAKFKIISNCPNYGLIKMKHKWIQ